MNTRAFTLALIIAVFAALMVDTYVSDQEESFKKDFGTFKSVVVAGADIKELELIDDSKLRVITVPQSFLMPGHFTTMKDLENTIATVPILKGEQITKPRVTYPGAKTGLSRQVTIGKRAIAIQVNDITAVGKLIKPGDRVDVISGIDFSDGRKDKHKIKTILQDILVLSTGRSMTNSIPIIGVKTPKVIRKMNLNVYEKYNTVTLEVDPFQAQKLLYLRVYSGQDVYLSLRNNSDKKIERIKATRIFDVLGDDAAEAKTFFTQKYQDGR